MKKYNILIIPFLVASLLITACSDDFLTRPPQDEFTDEDYWTGENNVRTFAWDFYTEYFPGYAAGFDLSWGGYFSGQSLNDDFAPTTPTPFLDKAPESGGGWSFSMVRKANIFIERIQDVPMDDEAIRNWTGIARFFRAMEYAQLVKRFGDVPWYGHVLSEDDPELYKPRDPRTLVMDSVLADFQYAVENVRESDDATGPAGLIVNKFVVLAFMSRVFLFEGTWQKYHEQNQGKAEEYLEVAKWAANEIMTNGGYSLGPDYRSLFNSLDLSKNPEMIMYRQYEEGVLTHSLNSYVNREGQTGVSKDAVDAYLASDGLPIGVSDQYQGDKSIENVTTNRDPRLTATIIDSLRLNGEGQYNNYSTTGFTTIKFLNEDIKDLPIGLSNQNPTDAPVIRYGEVLINYAEASAELGTLTQADLDKSINLLRSRPGVEMPPLQVIGGQPAVNNVVYDDPARDPSVPSLIWEIRRERRIELMMEGFRFDDLRRWAKLEYTDTEQNSDINRGAWVVEAEHPNMVNVVIENGAPAGYIIPSPAADRFFNDPRVYLYPLPLDQINLYEEQGVELTQNPGW